MQGKTRQRGITMWGLIFIVFVSVFFIFLAFKLVPPYMTDWNVSSSLKRVAAEPGASSESPQDLKASISKQFDIDYINSMQPYNIEIINDSSGMAISTDYTVLIPIMGNISASIHFSHTFPVG